MLIVFLATNTIPAFMQTDAYKLVLRSQTEFNTEFQFPQHFTLRPCPRKVFKLETVTIYNTLAVVYCELLLSHLRTTKAEKCHLLGQHRICSHERES
jgi:hypothetical protein